MVVIQTGRGHLVRVVDGDAEAIVARGRQIVHVAVQMAGAGAVLAAVSEGAAESEGRSIARIRDEVGGAHTELRRAAERYKPTGQAMQAYGRTLAEVQARMRRLVPEIESAKHAADAAGDAADAASRAAAGSADYDAADPVAAATHREDSREAAERAAASVRRVEDLEALLAEFDHEWETWAAAYDAASAAVGESTHGNVTDDWTDDLGGMFGDLFGGDGRTDEGWVWNSGHTTRVSLPENIRVVGDDVLLVIDGEIVGSVPIDDYIDIRGWSMHNVDSDTLVLGRWVADGSSYIDVARRIDATYFDMGVEGWDDVKARYDLADPDMFELFNKPALDDAVARQKTIRFSHYPDRKRPTALLSEWLYLKRHHGYSDLRKDGDGWIAVP